LSNNNGSIAAKKHADKIRKSYSKSQREMKNKIECSEFEIKRLVRENKTLKEINSTYEEQIEELNKINDFLLNKCNMTVSEARNEVYPLKHLEDLFKTTKVLRNYF
jgi:cupin superfamily acireductone dioxygenase involved in methionine salvage